MSRRPLALLVLALCALGAPPAAALSPHFNPKTMMPSSEIRRGMKGVGKSVFEGTKITDFNVQVLGVLEKSNLGQDVIIVRILDGPVVERKTGVMGGMSGSPVYIGGRLIGAIAFTWNFEQEPVAGVTAVDSMLQSLDQPAKAADLSPYSSKVERYAATGPALSLHGRSITGLKIVPAALAQQPFADDHTLLMRRVAAPLYCAGLSPGAMSRLKEVFRPFGVDPVVGPGPIHEPVDVDLVPGAAFGSQLLGGDFDVSTGGTITYREGDLVLGFGHPFMEAGNTAMSLTTSWVYDFIPCLSRTDKMMSTMKTVGTLTQDRSWSVGGRLGQEPPFIPATIKITDRSRNLTKVFHVFAARSRQLAPEMLATAVSSALGAAFNCAAQGTVRVKLHAKGSRGQEITRVDEFAYDGDAERPAIMSVLEVGVLLQDNRFRPQDISSVDYEAELSDVDNTAVIESVYTDETVARAGKDLTIHVRLRPHNAAPVEKAVTLKLPLDLEKGRLRVGAAGGNEAMHLRSRLGVLSPVFYDLDAVIDQYQNMEHGTQLFVAAGHPVKGAMVQGTRLLQLPAYFQSILETSERTDVTLGSEEIAQTVDVPWTVLGGASLTLTLEDREGRRGGPTPPTPPRKEGSEAASRGLPLLPASVPASLWWAASAFTSPPDAGLGDLRGGAPIPMATRPPAVTPLTPRSPTRWVDEGDTDDQTPDEPTPSPKGPEKPGEKGKAKPKPAEGKPGAKPGAKPEEKPEEKPEDKGDDKTAGLVGRKPAVWSQTTEDDFADCKSEGMALSSDGSVRLGYAWAELPRFHELYAWCLAADGDTAYAGTLDPGRIFRLQGKTATLLCDTGEFGVTALVKAPEGALLAATVPHGRILRVTPEGKVSLFCKLDVRYIWDLISDGADGYYAAVGPGAAVYHLGADGKAEKVAGVPHSHVTRLAMLGKDLCFGTAQPGAVYCLHADKTLTSVYDASKLDITALAAGEDGALRVGTAPKGRVISVKPGGGATLLYEDSDTPVLSLACLRGKTYAGMADEGQIIEITDRDTHATLRDEGSSQITALCLAGCRLFAASANPGTVYVADLDAAGQGKLDSHVLDTKSHCRWGRVDWTATVPEGARLAIRVRSGDTADPEDGSWSGWSSPVSEPGRDRVPAPPAQFLQYRLEMAKAAGGQPPHLDALRISYLPATQRPTVKDPKPHEGEAISGKYKLSWKMEDPDKGKLRASFLIRAHGKKDFQIIKEGITAGEYEWDTKTVADGIYDLRIVVDNSLSNPGDAEQDKLDIHDVVVDNTPPEIGIISGPALQASGGFALTGFAMDATADLAGISWKVEGDDTWHAALLDEGLCDWKYERFLIATPPLAETVTTLTIRARDAAGNYADKVVKLERPKKEAPKK